MKETIRIVLTQGQYQQLKEIGVSNSEIKSYGCTHPSSGVTIDHYMTVGVKTRVTGGNHTIDNIDTTPIQVESLAGGAEWNGEGLPPVGTVCQYKDTNQWFNVEITYLSEWVIVFKCLDESGRLVTDIKGVELAKNVDEHPEFRKPETEAERNERERLEAAYELYEFAMNGDEIMLFATFKVSHQLNGIYLRIVDKTGYRKAVTNE
ncbi:hypothetical protein KW491_06240 [Vibrio fluvialis]|nr:hypothetical protein [Vibrio fluvialis]MBY8132168.1 hypothetical protein [Vibrio fluvialis]